MSRKAVILVGAALAVLIAGGVVAFVVVRQTPEKGGLDTKLEGVTEPDKAEEPVTVPDRKPAKGPVESCWLTYGGNPERTSDASHQKWGVPRKRVWGKRMGALMEFPPSVCDGYIYVNDADGFTWALSTANGRVKWKRRTGTMYDSTPLIHGQYLVTGGIDRNITALDRENGKTLWKVRAGAPVESSPVSYGDKTVIVASLDRRVYSIAIRTGNIRWAYRSGGEIKGSPVIHGKTIYTANYAGEVLALRANTGRVRWRRAYRLDPFRTERIYSSTPYSKGSIFFGTVGGYVYSLKAKSGRERWRFRTGSYVYSTPAIAKDTVFVGDYGGTLYALKQSSGAVRWKARVGKPISGSPVVIGNNVYVSSIRGGTFAYDIRSGKRTWKEIRGKYVPGIATDKHIYLSLNGYLSAWKSGKGK